MVRGQQRGLSPGVWRGRLADAADGQATVRGQRHRSVGRQSNLSTASDKVKRYESGICICIVIIHSSY